MNADEDGGAATDAARFRDDAWLARRVEILWEAHFHDVPIRYPIVTRFGMRARRRYGSIMARDGQALITINRLFADPSVPEYVVDATLGHELAHYAHGFGSGLPLLHAHAHRGGVVDKELEARGLGEVSRRAEEWRRIYWEAFYTQCCPESDARQYARKEDAAQRWNALLGRPAMRSEETLQLHLRALMLRFRLPETCPDPFEVMWLQATLRQKAPSYWFAREQTVRLHGLLADPQVPDAVLDAELAYWLASRIVGRRPEALARIFARADLVEINDTARRWRGRFWPAFLRRNHPLA